MKAKKPLLKLLAIALAATILLACTHEELYETTQGNQKLNCQKLPDDQYEQCIKDANQSYEDYER
jgi:hypothetical protein